MSKRKGAKGGGELERLVEAWLQLNGWTTHRAAAVTVRLPGGKTFSKSHDLFGVFDFLAAKRAPSARDLAPETWALQVTVPDKRAARRAKVEAAGPWPRTWRVSVLHHLSARVGRSLMHWFMVEDWNGEAWSEPVKVEVFPAALKGWRSAKKQAKDARKPGASYMDVSAHEAGET